MTTETATRRLLTNLRRDLERLRAARTATPALRRLRADPSRILSGAGYPPDSWQRTLLRSTSDRVLMLITRQGGKSLTAAAIAVREALLRPPALVLLLSPTLRQSGELFRDKVKRLYNGLGWPVPAAQETQLTMELANGSRIVSLPGEEETIRGYSGVRLLVVDEAARVPDALYYSIRPMLAVSRGRLICLSTPYGRRGFFWRAWDQGGDSWQRVCVPWQQCPRITADQCPRIGAGFLIREEQALGPRWYRQEYFCSFEETIDQVFSQADIQAALADEVRPLFGG